MNDTANGNTLSAVQANARATGEAFERLANMVAQRTEFAPIADQARERATKLAANKFTVMVLGQFKRGKSTLLNAMLGARVLPMKLTPCTAVVTFLRHGLAPKAFVAFSDNRNPNQEVLSLDEFTEKYELKVADTALEGTESLLAARQEIADRFGPVEQAVIQYPSPFMENGVEFMDTPGLEEHDARTRRVLEALPTADAIIMVLDATQLLTTKEMQFIDQYLRPLGLHERVFFPINRWNLVVENALDPNDPGEVEKIAAEQMQLINTRLVPFVSGAGRAKVAKRIFKVNALGALRQRLKGANSVALEATEIPAFERALCEFLTVDRDEARRAGDSRIADDIERKVEKEIAAAVGKACEPITNFKAEQAKLDAQLDELRRIKGNIESIIRASAAETASVLGPNLETYLSEKLFDHLEEHVARFDFGELDSILTQYNLLLDAFRADENKLGKRIADSLQQQIMQLITRHIDEWREAYMVAELKVRTADLQQRLRYEAGKYMKILSEIRGESEEREQVSDKEISRKIVEWLTGYRPDFTTTAAGAGFDLAPLLAGIVGDIVLQKILLAGNVLLPGVGLLASGLFALMRKERNKSKAKEQIVNGLQDKRKELLLDQRMKLGKSVEEAYKNLSEPISKSIAAEIDVVGRNMSDVLAKRQRADFDAGAFERDARAFEAAVKANVREIHQLAG